MPYGTMTKRTRQYLERCGMDPAFKFRDSALFLQWLERESWYGEFDPETGMSGDGDIVYKISVNYEGSKEEFYFPDKEACLIIAELMALDCQIHYLNNGGPSGWWLKVESSHDDSPESVAFHSHLS